ncbi:hypothetical protein ZWY2020_029255 [Hordeum vulgare]|nr:hypothetical protein ZWY2020_029255 [Hordeum vulgare]
MLAARRLHDAAKTLPSSPRFTRPSPSPDSSPALTTETTPWLGFRAGLCRRISSGPRLVPPSLLAGIRHPYTSPSLFLPPPSIPASDIGT